MKRISEKKLSTKTISLILLPFVLIIFYTIFYFINQRETRTAETLKEEQERMARESEELGLSPVKDGRIVFFDKDNEEIKYDTTPGDIRAPRQSSPIKESQIPQDSIKIVATKDKGYIPSRFTVNSGDLITLSLVSEDGGSYVFRFKDPSLSSIAIGVGGDEIRVIRFNAPRKGEYDFYCDVPGCNLTGKMIVE